MTDDTSAWTQFLRKHKTFTNRHVEGRILNRRENCWFQLLDDPDLTLEDLPCSSRAFAMCHCVGVIPRAGEDQSRARAGKAGSPVVPTGLYPPALA